MSNIYDYGVNGSFPSRVGGTGTTPKYFPRLIGINGTIIGSAGLGGVSGSSVAAPLFGTAPANPSANSAVGSLYLPAQNDSNGQQLEVLASGAILSDNPDPSSTVTIQLYVVTGSLNAPVYTSIATTGAITPNFLVEPWSLEANLMGVSTLGANGFMIGSYQAAHRGSFTAPVVTSTTISGLDFLNGNPALQQGAVCGFVVGVTFGTSDALNGALLHEFTIES